MRASKPSRSAKRGGAQPTARSTPRSKTPTTRSQREAEAARRRRLPVIIAAVIAVVILATGFPVTHLYRQHQQVAAAAAQLAAVTHENHQLSIKRQQLNSDAEVTRLARQDYQLVAPGQALYEVLPPSGSQTGGGAVPGDPANQPLYEPGDAPSVTPDAGLPSSPGSTVPSSPTSSSTPHPAGGFWSRVRTTIEFWK